MRSVVCAVVLAAGLAACGGGGDDEAALGSTSTTVAGSSSTAAPGPDEGAGGGNASAPGTDAPAPPTTQDVAADQALVQSIVLRPADAPSGWVAQAPDGDDDDSGYDRRYAECVGVPVEQVDPSFPEADGHDLSSPDDQFQASGSATAAPSAEAARPLIEAYRRPDTPTCFADVLREVLLDAMAESGSPPGLTVDQPTFERIAYPAIGDEVEAFRLTMTLRGDGGTVEMYADAVLIRSGRVVLELLFMGLVEPFPTAESEHLSRLMAGRVPAP